MWKCKNCGNINGFVKIIDVEFSKEGDEIDELFLSYKCPSCQDIGSCIEDIAEWHGGDEEFSEIF